MTWHFFDTFETWIKRNAEVLRQQREERKFVLEVGTGASGPPLDKSHHIRATTFLWW